MLKHWNLYRYYSSQFIQLSISGTSRFKHKRDSKVHPQWCSCGRMTRTPLEFLRGLLGFISFRGIAACCAEREACYIYEHIYIYIHRCMQSAVRLMNDKYVKHGRTYGNLSRERTLHLSTKINDATPIMSCERMSPGVSRSCVSDDRVLELGRVEIKRWRTPRADSRLFLFRCISIIYHPTPFGVLTGATCLSIRMS